LRLFAYGTLMTADGFRSALGDRAAGLRFQVARLAGWKRAWNAYRPEWEGAVLNIEPDPGGVVVGVLVDGLTDLDWALLDDQERTHLPRERVSVELDGGQRVPAETYRMRNATYRGARSPRYEAAVRERARAAGEEVLQNLLLP
jgi:gamma-glutamyl AIG2-like cyclotransferase